MLDIISQFFGLIGLDMSVPATFAELLPWFVQVLLGIAMIAFVFQLFNAFVRSIYGRKWM